MSLISRYPLVEFFGLAYALSWILESPLAYAPALLLCKILHTHTGCGLSLIHI